MFLQSFVEIKKPEFFELPSTVFVDSAKRANCGRACIKLNQPSYKDSLKPAACVKPWFRLDLNFFCFLVSLVDCKYTKHLPQFLHVNFFSLFLGFCLFVLLFMQMLEICFSAT